MVDDPQPLLRVIMEDGHEVTMLRSETPRKDPPDYSNVIGLLLLMQEIQKQEPLDDPDVIFIDKDGTRYY
ncbi:MAG: hypothetical protein AAB489_03560 [Patescibacteria group bacterium]